MACQNEEPTPSKKDEWEEIEEEITCSICNEMFTEPKTIPCLHTFCENCITSAIEIGKKIGRDICCPVCRAELPEDLKAVPTNFSTKRLIEIFKKRQLSMKQKGDEMRCGGCEDNNPAIMWCADCESLLCEDCYKPHGKMKVFKSHKTVTIDDFMKTPKEVLITYSQVQICENHIAQSLDLFCTTCSILICRDCTYVDHKDHQYNFVDKLADAEWEKIKFLAVSLKETLEKVRAAIKKVETSDHEIEAKYKEEVIKQIKGVYHQLHHFFEQQESNNLQVADATRNSLRDSLNSQREELKFLEQLLVSCNDFVSEVSVVQKSAQLLTYSRYITSRVVELMSKVQQTKLDPVCGANKLMLPDVSVNSCIDQLTSLYTPSTQVPKNGVTANVKAIRDYTSIQQPVQVISEYSAKRKKWWCPYLLALAPNDRLITRDFSTFCKRMLVLDDKLQYFCDIGMGSYKCPTGLAVHKLIFLYVAEFIHGCVKKFKLSGGEFLLKIGSLGAGEGQFQNPRGLLSSQSGKLFVCDSGNDRIQVLVDDKYSYSFGRHGKDPGKFDCPVGMAMNNAEDLLFITELKNHRVQVFTPAGKFVRVFGDFSQTSFTLKNAYGVFYTHDGHVLVSSGGTNCVLIFKEDGSFVSAIEGTFEGEERFSKPVGVVMTKGGQIVVAGHDSHNLVVF